MLIGRDRMVNSSISGTTSFGGTSYTATAQYITGLMQPGASGESFYYYAASSRHDLQAVSDVLLLKM